MTHAFFQLKFNICVRCDMAFIEPMHRNKPNITYLLTYCGWPFGSSSSMDVAGNAHGCTEGLLMWTNGFACPGESCSSMGDSEVDGPCTAIEGVVMGSSGDKAIGHRLIPNRGQGHGSSFSPFPMVMVFFQQETMMKIMPSHSHSVSQQGCRDVAILSEQDWTLPEPTCTVVDLLKLSVMPSPGSSLSGHLSGGLMKKGCNQPLLPLEDCCFPATTSDVHRPQGVNCSHYQTGPWPNHAR